MFRILVSLLFLVSLSLAAGAPQIKVAVTLPPYARILNDIGGERVEALTLIPANANPHTFEPRPETLKQFARAVLYFSDGSGMDRGWMPRFLSANKNVQVDTISGGILWMEEKHEPGEHAEPHQGHKESGEAHELDPHLWNSPLQAKLLGENMAAALMRVDPQGKAYYEKRLAAFRAHMDSLDVAFRSVVTRLPEDSRIFLVFHPSFGYLARDYGLTQEAVEVEGKEPRPRDLSRLVDQAKKHHIHVIFVQPQFSRRAAETLAKELNALVVTTDPLAYDFDVNLRQFLDALLKAAGK